MNDQSPPAFPSDKGCDSWQCRKPSSGMSLRDYFATAALTGLLASESEDHSFLYPTYTDGVTGKETTIATCYPRNSGGVSSDGPVSNTVLRTAEQNIALKAYTLADAMLTTRNS